MQEATPLEARAGIEVSREGGKRVSLARMTEAARRAGNRSQPVAKLSYQVREAILRQEPWLLRGITKQTGDLVKHGFTVLKPGTDETHTDDPLMQAWLRKTRAFQRAREALFAAHAHGDGLVEVEWDDGGAPDQPVRPGSMPIGVHVIDPVNTEFVHEREGDKVVTYLVQENSLNGERPVVLHPDRYHHFFFYRLPGYDHGIPTVEVGYHVAMAKVKGDQGSGEVVYNAGQPKVHVVVKEADEQKILEKVEMVNDPDFVRGWVTGDDTTITQLNPLALDVEPLYEVWKSSTAAVVGLPIMLLEGAQAGELSGSETNLADYHSDLLQVKVNVLQDFFVRMTSAVILATEESFDLQWTPPPTLPSVMATIAREKANAMNLFRTAGLTKEAAAREAGLELGPDDFEDEPDPLLGTPPVEPGPDGQPPRGTVPRDE